MKIKTKYIIISLLIQLLFSCKGAVDPPVLDDSEENDGFIAPDLEYSIIYDSVEFSLDLSLLKEIPADTDHIIISISDSERYSTIFAQSETVLYNGKEIEVSIPHLYLFYGSGDYYIEYKLFFRSFNSGDILSFDNGEYIDYQPNTKMITNDSFPLVDEILDINSYLSNKSYIGSYVSKQNDLLIIVEDKSTEHIEVHLWDNDGFIMLFESPDSDQYFDVLNKKLVTELNNDYYIIAGDQLYRFNSDSVEKITIYGQLYSDTSFGYFNTMISTENSLYIANYNGVSSFENNICKLTPNSGLWSVDFIPTVGFSYDFETINGKIYHMNNDSLLIYDELTDSEFSLELTGYDIDGFKINKPINDDELIFSSSSKVYVIQENTLSEHNELNNWETHYYSLQDSYYGRIFLWQNIWLNIFETGLKFIMQGNTSLMFNSQETLNNGLSAVPIPSLYDKNFNSIKIIGNQILLDSDKGLLYFLSFDGFL